MPEPPDSDNVLFPDLSEMPLHTIEFARLTRVRRLMR